MRFARHAKCCGTQPRRGGNDRSFVAIDGVGSGGRTPGPGAAAKRREGTLWGLAGGVGEVSDSVCGVGRTREPRRLETLGRRDADAGNSVDRRTCLLTDSAAASVLFNV